MITITFLPFYSFKFNFCSCSFSANIFFNEEKDKGEGRREGKREERQERKT